MNSKTQCSAEQPTATQTDAAKIAKATQKPGQTKEQTRLIALGIQKGIAEYKKSAKIKQREADKAKKKKQQTSQQVEPQAKDESTIIVNKNNSLPWILLVVSWDAFAAYFIF